MNARLAIAAVLAVILRPHLTAGGVSVPLTGPLILGAVIVTACALLAVAAVRGLHRFQCCPHLRTIRAAP